MRLIDADALLEELKKTYHYFDLKFLIEDAPTIEPSGDSGVFIPDISVEQLRNAPLEGVEELLAEGVMRDVLEPSKSRPYGNCAECIHIYGTLGCCSTVNNEWVYDCDYGMAQYKINTAEPSGDLISRAEVLALINKAIYNTDNKEIQNYLFCGIRRDVHNLPSADAVSREDYNKLFVKMLEYKAEVIGKMFEHKPEVADRPTDDLVSREAIVDTILETNTRLKEQTTINHLIENIDALPSAEPAPVVAYICDRRRCAICRGKDGGCDHTTDIKHAAHFKNVAGQYFERPYMEEEDDG